MDFHSVRMSPVATQTDGDVTLTMERAEACFVKTADCGGPHRGVAGGGGAALFCGALGDRTIPQLAGDMTEMYCSTSS